MKSILVYLFVLFVALSNAARVQVVDNNHGGHGHDDLNVDAQYYQPSFPIVEDSAFYQPSNGPNIVDDHAFYQPSYGPNIVDDQAFYQPSYGPNIVEDSAFYRPTYGNNPNGGYEQISGPGPALVDQPYPYKQYGFAGARDGKK